MRLSKVLCTNVGQVLSGSHRDLEALFVSAGAPGDPPDMSHGTKWKEWLFRAGADPHVDSLAVLGGVLEEFMDLPPAEGTPEFDAWLAKREAVEAVLEENGLRYFRFGRVLPQGERLGLAADAVPGHDASSARMPRCENQGGCPLEVRDEKLGVAKHQPSPRRSSSEHP